uniref:Uncharacterized protein n=1 Tax=Vitis vinifera TaxID=29760 RepID=A5B7P3_VITVI|nr:hypothetical protein VITISV_039413 [Vitis vinifera]
MALALRVLMMAPSLTDPQRELAVVGAIRNLEYEGLIGNSMESMEEIASTIVKVYQRGCEPMLVALGLGQGFLPKGF